MHVWWALYARSVHVCWAWYAFVHVFWALYAFVHVCWALYGFVHVCCGHDIVYKVRGPRMLHDREH